MTARIIWIGKNNEMAVVPRSASSAGMSAAARPVVLPQRGRAAPIAAVPNCHRTVRVPDARQDRAAATTFLQPRAFESPRGNLGGSALRTAPSFDATAERWIVPPSRMTRESGAAADLRHSDETPCLESPAASLAPTAAGHLEAISEVLKMAVGLTVFGLVAGFFLVMA